MNPLKIVPPPNPMGSGSFTDLNPSCHPTLLQQEGDPPTGFGPCWTIYLATHRPESGSNSDHRMTVVPGVVVLRSVGAVVGTPSRIELHTWTRATDGVRMGTSMLALSICIKYIREIALSIAASVYERISAHLSRKAWGETQLRRVPHCCELRRCGKNRASLRLPHSVGVAMEVVEQPDRDCGFSPRSKRCWKSCSAHTNA